MINFNCEGNYYKLLFNTNSLLNHKIIYKFSVIYMYMNFIKYINELN